MKIAITGSTGFIGQNLVPFLKGKGHDVIPMVRFRQLPGVFWDPEASFVDTESLSGIDAVIHLAGESVAERWSPEKKTKIYSSRVTATRMLVDALGRMPRKPADFISASAIGYYGERGTEVLTEDSDAGTTFLSRVCVDWEAAAATAAAQGMRASSLRFGIVLSTEGGAFPKMLAPFEAGAGGKLGTGRQFMSWIELGDTLSAIDYVLQNPRLAGPVNLTAPTPVTNIEFTEMLGQILNKPTMIQVPVAMAHLAYGSEMANEVLLASDRVVPERLSISGFQFRFTKLDAALRHVISRL